MNIFSRLNSLKKLLIEAVILLFISTSCLFAQNNRIDSLKQKLEGTPESESFEINFQLAREFTKLDYKVALGFATKAKSLAYHNKDSLAIVRSPRISGQLQRRLDNLDSSIYYFSGALAIARRNKFIQEEAAILNALGVVYILLSNYDQALYWLFQSLAFCERSGDKEMTNVTYNNIGLVYYKLEDAKSALKYFKKCLELKTAIKDNFTTDILLINISICHSDLGELIEARRRLQPVLDKCLLTCDDEVLVIALHASGMIFFESGDLRKSEKDLLRSYDLARASKNQRFIFEDIIYLSKIYLKIGNITSAQKLLVEGESMIKKSHFDLEEMKLYEQLCSLYATKENYKKLSFYQEKYIQMKDSVYSQNQATNLMRLYTAAIEKENKMQLASQEKTLRLKDQIINKQFGINILIGITVVLLITLIYILTKIFLQRREANYLLNKKVLERSNELLQNQQSLRLAIEQRDVALVKLSQDLSNSIESMRRLCSAGSETQTDSNAQRYFDEISITTLNLSNSLNSILPESKMA